MAADLVVNITAEGKTTFSVVGATGNECIGLTEAFEKALGEVDGEREYKPSFYEQNKNNNSNMNYNSGGY